MSWLIDTNVISEVRKGPRCDRRVAVWYATVDAADLYLSVLVLGEICKGIALIARREPERADALAEWLAMVRRAFAGRILPVDEEVAEQWGRLAALRPAPVTDALLAATALVHG